MGLNQVNKYKILNNVLTWLSVLYSGLFFIAFVGAILWLGIKGVSDLTTKNFNITISLLIALIIFRVKIGWGSIMSPSKLSDKESSIFLGACLLIGLLLVVIPDGWDVSESGAIMEIIEWGIFISFIMLSLVILMRLFYFAGTMQIVPKLLDKHGIIEKDFDNKNLIYDERYRNYEKVKFRGKYWYFPVSPFNGNSASEKRAYNYINRRRYPLNYSILEE